ncbi:MAG: hypothetical protein MOB07_10160 [Acidobacteria bacterium]|nr:hypothetical protein [Acidobacteriota bacterium]
MADDDNNDRDLERVLEAFANRIFNASTKRERKKAEKELRNQIARPALTTDVEQMERELRIRLNERAALPPSTPEEYKKAFAPFLELLLEIPPPEQQNIGEITLTTQHMVRFRIEYGVEPLLAQIALKAFSMLCPAPGIFEKVVADPNKSEHARKTKEFIERLETDVLRCVTRATEEFVESLRGRLGSALDQTLNEIVIRAIKELEPTLNNVGNRAVKTLRKAVLGEWGDVEKVRLDTPAPGRPKGTTYEKLEKERETFIQDVNAAIARLKNIERGNIGLRLRYGKSRSGLEPNKEAAAKTLRAKAKRLGVDVDELIAAKKDRTRK